MNFACDILVLWFAGFESEKALQGWVLFIQKKTKANMAQERVGVAVVDCNIEFRLLAYNITAEELVHQSSNKSDMSLQIGLTIPLRIRHLVKGTVLSIGATLTASHGDRHGFAHITVSSSDGD